MSSTAFPSGRFHGHPHQGAAAGPGFHLEQARQAGGEGTAHQLHFLVLLLGVAVGDFLLLP